jgi:hypothetical protein
MNYRKIWESINGKIPTDKKGRKYEIHHIDGNRNNNSIENLICLSIEDHYNLHLRQGDYQAAGIILSRMKVSKEERLGVYKELSRVWTGKPKPWLRKPRPKVECPWCKQLTGGGGHQKSCKLNPNRTPALKPNLSLTVKGVPKRKAPCTFCTNEISLGNLKRHEKSCKMNPDREDFIWQKVTCPYCNLEGGLNIMNRFHFNNCKQKK